MAFALEGMCRGNGRGYVRLSAPGVRAEDLYARAVAANGAEIACAVYPFGFPAEDPAAVRLDGDAHAGDGTGVVSFVVAVPLLDGTDLDVRLYGRGTPSNEPLFSFPFSPLRSKVRSRLTYRFHPEEAARMRDIDERRRHEGLRVFVPGMYPIGGGEVSCRFVVRDEFIPSAVYDIAVYDGAANRIGVEPIVIEDAETASHDDPLLRDRERLYSIRLPESARTVCISVTRRGIDGAVGNFACLLPPAYEGYVNGARDYTRNVHADGAYPQWLEKHRASYGDLEAQRVVIAGWKHRPRFSVVMTADGSPHAEDAVRSVLAQSYPDFELVVVTPEDGEAPAVVRDDPRVRSVKADGNDAADLITAGVCVAEGDYVAFLGCGDVLEPDALYRFAAELADHPDADLLYCDEDVLDAGTYRDPLFKPGFNRDLMYSYDYMGRMTVVSRHALDHIDLPGGEITPAYGYDLRLRAMEVAREVRGVPFMLCHRRAGTGTTDEAARGEAGRRALAAHFERTGVRADVRETGACRYRTTYAFDHEPKVSIVIPTKDHADVLANCVRSVLERTEYANYDVTLVENNSTEPETFAYYERIRKESDRVRVVTWKGRGFNYSAICNYGAAHTDGEIVLFLNNDTEVVAPGWLGSMVNFMARGDVGMVGAKLVCHDGIVQHGGIWVGDNLCGYLGYDLAVDDPGYMDTMRLPWDVAAVTGACQMVRRAVFDEVGGFDEKLAVVLNDVDLALKVGQAGYLVVYEPDAVLYHNEFTSRGRDERDPAKRRRSAGEYERFRMRWNATVEKGRFINANLNQHDGNFKLTW
ncbi:Glycosyl transferase family 2 [Bifidobacterium sp. DSM 109958]|uniref:Glycosyl transferase family 2 n=1 Tax=Bifidobacterium moraviense TaxID=2675323 RepID=A0A7Y0I015_9BIFI|nr:glycosyltransferase family 2 protein [Bifidobacterium sp. DSM 109958]NMN00820.1 Glycosyl transferase family 2 [Bifidobacterium sp. DSM 109958]